MENQEANAAERASVSRTALSALRPVLNKDGGVILIDMYVDGVWIGSRRTEAQCREALRHAR